MDARDEALPDLRGQAHFLLITRQINHFNFLNDNSDK